MGGRRAAQVAVLLAAVAAVVGCGRRNCVPEHLAKSKNLVDLSQPPDAHAPVERDADRRLAEDLCRRAGNPHPPGAKPYTFLALSGGGFYAPFGAGILTGWSDAGTRPQFDVVTGISTGALMSTFAFLGPEFDGMLREKFVGIERREIVRRRHLAAIPFAPSLFHVHPLRRQINDLLTPDMMGRVAQAHAEGRRLYIGTTNLDTRGLVIWDMGAIASRGTPEAAELYRDIVLASSAVPGVFPPVRIKVTIDGKEYEEFHVDGGVSDTVIFRPFMIADLNRLRGAPGHRAPPGSRLYVVNNGKLYAQPNCVRARVIPQLNASARSILYGKNRDELHRIYLICLESGVDYRVTAVPQDLQLSPASLDVPVGDQHRLYAVGRQIGAEAGAGAGGPMWRPVPPGFGPSEQVLPRAGTVFATTGAAGGVGMPCHHGEMPELPAAELR